MFNIKKIFNHLIYIIIPLTYVGLQLIFLDQYPHVLVDEPWYSSTAFNIGFNGQINNSLVGWRGAEELFFYPLLLAQWFKVFGVGLIQARLFSVFVGLGIVYLLFFWTAIPAIVGFIEGIIYLTCNSDEEFTRRFVH